MKPEEHTQGVGAIVTNLQALETVLRYFLLRRKKQEPHFPKPGDRITKKTYLTRSIVLQNLIRNYNGVLDEGESKYAVDKDMVRIRNAFAHGRLLTSTEIPARLWNFIGSKKGHMEIEFSEELTAEWLKATWLKIDGGTAKGRRLLQRARLQGAALGLRRPNMARLGDRACAGRGPKKRAVPLKSLPTGNANSPSCCR